MKKAKFKKTYGGIPYINGPEELPADFGKTPMELIKAIEKHYHQYVLGYDTGSQWEMFFAE